jgi:hypothetical protein
MKNLLILFFLYAGSVLAQEAPLKPTHQFVISGQIKKESVIKPGEGFCIIWIKSL